MPNTAKQEAIRKSYGEYWEQVKDKVDQHGRLTYQQCWDIWNGDTDESNFYSNVLQDKTLDLHDDYEGYYQPKSLQGIDDNRGWIRIESEEDLPKDSFNYYAFCSNGSVMTFNDFEYYKKYIIPELKVTHYQPIVKPEKPIY